MTAQAGSAGLDQQAARLADALSAFLELTKDWRQWEWAGRAGLDAASRAGDMLAEANAHAGLGKLQATRGHYPESDADLRHAAQPREALGEHFNLAGTLTRLGETSSAAGSYDAAREAWERAARILEELQHPSAGQVREKLRALP